MSNLQQVFIDLPNTQNPNRRFQVLKQVGQGSEGYVYLVKPINWQNHTQDVAIKVQPNVRDREVEFIDQLISYQQKWDLQEQFKSQIVRIYERTTYNGQMALIMEIGEMDLYRYIQSNYGKLSLLQKVQILQQMARSIKYLHSKQLMHRDLKPENFLKVGLEFKLIDFGQVQKSEQESKTKFIGSPLFFAPEIAQGSSRYSQEVDIWSLGCTFKEFLKESEIQQFEQNNDFIIKPQPNSPAIDQKIKALISNMLKQNPKERIIIDQVSQNLLEIQLLLSNQFQQPKFPQQEFQSQLNKQIPQNLFPQENNLVLQTNFAPTQQKLNTFPSSQFEKNQLLQINFNGIKEQGEQILKYLNTIALKVEENNNEIKKLKEQQKSNLNNFENKNIQKIEQVQQFVLQTTPPTNNINFGQLQQNQNQDSDFINKLSSKINEEIKKQAETIKLQIKKIDSEAQQGQVNDKLQKLSEQIKDLKADLLKSLDKKQNEIEKNNNQQPKFISNNNINQLLNNVKQILENNNRQVIDIFQKIVIDSAKQQNHQVETNNFTSCQIQSLSQNKVQQQKEQYQTFNGDSINKPTKFCSNDFESSGG